MDKGLKYDNDKLRMDLIPMDSLRDLAAVYTMGSKKYAEENWRKGISWKRIYGAVLRHLSAWFLGQDLDEESNLPHLAHAAWGLMTLLNYSRTHRELDDRPITHQESVPDATGNSHELDRQALAPNRSINAMENASSRYSEQPSHTGVPKTAGALVSETRPSQRDKWTDGFECRFPYKPRSDTNWSK